MPQPPDEIESKFMTATKFAGEIEKLVADNNDMNYFEIIQLIALTIIIEVQKP